MSTLFSSTTKISIFQKRGGVALVCKKLLHTRPGPAPRQQSSTSRRSKNAARAGLATCRGAPLGAKKMKPKTGGALVCIAQKLAARLRLQNFRNYMPLEPGACAPLARLTTREKVSCVRTRYTRELSPNFRTFSCVEKPARNRFPGRRGDAARRDCKAGCAAATIWPRV